MRGRLNTFTLIFLFSDHKIKTEKLLIFTLGEETYTPHIIGFKKILLSDIKGQEATEAELQGLEDHLLPYVNANHQNRQDFLISKPDHSLNMHGHIVGMAISPDQR